MTVFLVRSNSCLCSSYYETIKKSLFSFWDKNQRTSRWGLKDILQNIPWVMSNIYLASPLPRGSSPYSPSDTRVVFCYKRNSLCPQFISTRVIIFHWRLHESSSDIRVYDPWPSYLMGIFFWTFPLPTKQFTYAKTFVPLPPTAKVVLAIYQHMSFCLMLNFPVVHHACLFTKMFDGEHRNSF